MFFTFEETKCDTFNAVNTIGSHFRAQKTGWASYATRSTWKWCFEQCAKPKRQHVVVSRPRPTLVLFHT